MNTDIPIPLPLYPWPPSPERMDLIKQAKARIDTPVKIVPVEAGPMGTDRVLCFGSLPPYLAKTVPISPANVNSVDSIEAALRWWLDPWRDESRWDEGFQLGAWMGTDVRLAREEDHTGKVAFR